MGLSLEFYAGDPDTIGRAFSEVEFDVLRDGIEALAYADFSLHIASDDLNLLSEIMAKQLGVEPLLLNECLIGEVGSIDDGEGGVADIVHLAWVNMVALVREEDAHDIAARWMGALAHSHGEELEISEASIQAVISLIRLCKIAIAERVQVVHVWYL